MPITDRTNEAECIAAQEGALLYFIGINGSGMQGLAALSRDMGFCIRGEDARQSGETVQNGITHLPPQSSLPQGTALVVYSLAVPFEHPLLREAELRNIPACPRAVWLGILMRRFPIRIAIAGAHGKSSTVGMCARILTACGKDPTVIVGAPLADGEGGYRKGKGDILLIEACEYRDAFLAFSPTHAAVLNAEWEHTDYFESYAHVLRSYRSFLEGSSVLMRITGPRVPLASDRVFGKESGMHVTALRLLNGAPHFILMDGKRKCGEVRLKVKGLHQAENALAAAAVCRSLGVSYEDILHGLSSYVGVGGRMELCGKLGASPLYLDYAHHPTELSAVLSCAKSMADRIVCVFEPHTYSRVFAFEKEFCEALRAFDAAGILPIYPARERDTRGMSSERLARLCGGVPLADFASAAAFLTENAQSGTLLLLLGAGRVAEVLPLVTLSRS